MVDPNLTMSNLVQTVMATGGIGVLGVFPLDHIARIGMPQPRATGLRAEMP